MPKLQTRRLHRLVCIIVILALLGGTGCGRPPAMQVEGVEATAVEATAVVPTAVGTTAVVSTTQPGAAGADSANFAEPVTYSGAGADLIKQPGADRPVRWSAEGPEAARVDFGPIGSITWQAEPAGAASKEVESGAEPVEMQLVDSAGLTWKLVIPKGALDGPTTITMVPLSQVKSEDVPGVVSGILLEPDGIQFHLPVQLSVSGPGLDAHTLILSGSQSAPEVDYAHQDLAAEQPTARILHFSSYFASRPEGSELDKVYQQANKEYNKLVQEANKLFQKDIEVPQPPSIPLECPDSETGQKNGKQLADFIAKALQPEQQLVARMLQMRTVMGRAGGDEGSVVGDVETILMSRQYRKVTEMMMMYQGQEDKWVAVSSFAIEVARQLQLLGVYTSVSQAILQDLAKWADGMVNKLVKDVRDNHNYKKIPVVLLVARQAALLSGDGSRSEAIVEKLRSALRFEVTVNFTLNFPDMNWATESKVQVQFEPGQLTTCQGSGQGSYTSASSTVPGTTIETESFPVQVVVKDFDPCEGTVTIGVDNLSAPDEHYIITMDDGTTFDYYWSLVKDSGSVFYGDKQQDGMYFFTMKVQNGNPTAAEESFPQSKHGKIDGVLKLKFLHK